MLLFSSTAAAVAAIWSGHGARVEAVVPSPPVRIAPAVRAASVEIDRAPDSLFYIRGTVGTAAIDFAIDSGASVVVLTPADAARLGLNRTAVSVTAQTASGATAMHLVKIDRMDVGGRVLRNVDAAIAGNGATVSLLGQSALSRFEAVTFRKNSVRFE